MEASRFYDFDVSIGGGSLKRYMTLDMWDTSLFFDFWGRLVSTGNVDAKRHAEVSVGLFKKQKKQMLRILARFSVVHSVLSVLSSVVQHQWLWQLN